MVLRRYVVGALALAGSVAIAGCSSSPGASNSTTSTSGPVATTTTPSGGGSGAAANQTISNAIRAQLVAAGAALNNIPASEYSGLTPGLTFYAYNRKTGTFWAGARLDPAPSPDPSSPTQAQISSQDAGSYYIFTRPQGGGWTAHAAGNTGPGTACPVVVPESVLRAWGWPAGSCRPSGA